MTEDGDTAFACKQMYQMYVKNSVSLSAFLPSLSRRKENI